MHQYKLNNYNIVLDVFSGAIHSVDELAYDIISLFEVCSEGEIIRRMQEKYSATPDITLKEISDCIADIRELKNTGQLFTPDKIEGEALVFEAENRPIKALCLHLAHTCNLSCGYCFASQGKYRGDSAPLMSFDVGKRALDFLLENSGGRTNLEVDFFGGEPLMNWDVCKRLVAYARSREKDTGKRFRFTLTTNGLLIDDDVIEFSNREIENVVLSLDGRRDVHNKYRKTESGQGSYDLVVPKFQDFIKARAEGEKKEYYMRGTYTRFNADFALDILHMVDLGFKQLSIEPVVCPPGELYALRSDDLPQLFEQYENLAKEMISRNKRGEGFVFYHYMIDLERGPCVHKRVLGCGVGTEYLAVTPSGELFPCHQFVGLEAFSMGNLWDGVTNKALRRGFGRCSAYTKKACRDCWAKLYCAGGCAANAFHASSDINGVCEYECELFKKRIECAIMIKTAGLGCELRV